MHISRTQLIGSTLAILALLGTGCSSWRGEERSYREDARRYLEKALERDALARVRPWERDLLARTDMGWQPDRLQALRRSHIFFSKEASLIGGGSGGGGCGCN